MCFPHSVASDIPQAPGMDAGGRDQFAGSNCKHFGVLLMAKFKPYLVTAVTALVAIVIYKKFLGGKFGLPMI